VNSQSGSIGNGSQTTSSSVDQSFLKKLEKVILDNIQNEQFGVQELAEEMHYSRFQIYRKINILTGLSISQFIQRIRLNQAMELLKNKAGTASEIAYMVGFGSPTYFSKCFTKYFGFPPGEVKKLNFADPAGDSIQTERKSYNNLAVRGSKSGGYNLGKKFNLFSFIKVSAFFIPIVAVLSTYVLPGMPGFSEKLFGSILTKAGGTEKSIALVKFRDLNPEGENQFLAMGIMEAINSHLSGIKGIRVSSRTTTAQYLDTDVPLTEIGKELEVTYVLDGSIQKFDDQIRITLRLIDVSYDRNIWSKQYTESYQNLFELMTLIALNITKELEVTISPAEEAKLARHPDVDLDAYELYMRGRMYLTLYETSSDKVDLFNAEKLFRQSISTDSSLALAYTGLAEINDYKRAFSYMSSAYEKEYTDSIFFYTSKAIALDPNLSDAYVYRGLYYAYKNQLDQAIRDQEKAISLNPNLAESYFHLGQILFRKKGDPLTAYRYLKLAQFYGRSGEMIPDIYFVFGDLFYNIGDFKSAEKYFRRTIQLYPDNYRWNGPLAWINLVQGRYDIAESYIIKACENSPYDRWCYTWLTRIYAYKEDFETAMDYWEKAQNKKDDFYNPVNAPDTVLEEVQIPNIFIKTGKRKEGLRMLNTMLKKVQGDSWNDVFQQAEIYASLGDYEKVMERIRKLEKLIPYEGIFNLMQNSYLYEPLQDDPEFVAILDRVNGKKAVMREKIARLEEEDIRSFALK
jgi:TolB-like protein/AraC-like DNA-binding protein/Tfp pilus assembly protein PilF